MKFKYGNVILATATAVCLSSTAFAGAYGEGAAAEETAAAAPAAACPECEETGPNSGNVSLTFQNDFTTAYFFRGILQENDGMIWEPTLAIGLKVYGAEEGVLRSVNLGVGTWHSVHEEKTLASGSGPDVWYEADIYPSLSLTWGGGVSTSVSYIWYTSPNNAFTTTEEVDLVLAFDDSPYLDKFALHPSLTLAFETKGGSFQDFWNGTNDGHGKGSVAILAIAPSYAIPLSDDYPLTLALPVTVGLSMDDYYEDSNHNETFGYATLGLTANIPLAFIPKAYGTWSITNGINLLFLNDALADVNGDAVPANDDFEAVWTSSVIMTY